MSVSSIASIASSSTAPSSTASTARAIDGDYKTKGVGHEVKDADGDYKPTKPTVAAPAAAAANASTDVQNALLSLTKGGA